MKALTDGKGVAVVLDMVGGDYLPRNLACLADDGRHVSIAFQRGADGRTVIPDIMRRRLTLTGSTLRPRSVDFKTMVADRRRCTGGKGVAVVLDMVGGDYVPRNLDCLADDGRHVSIAFQRGAERARSTSPTSCAAA